MTAVESLRRQVANLLGIIADWDVDTEFHDACMVLADACEEAGDERGAEFWRLVAVRQVWPNQLCASRLWSWRWEEYPADTLPYARQAGIPHVIHDIAVFDFLGRPTRMTKKTWHGGLRLVKSYRSLSKAILSLEKAWGAVDCEAASV